MKQLQVIINVEVDQDKYQELKSLGNSDKDIKRNVARAFAQLPMDTFRIYEAPVEDYSVEEVNLV